MLDHYQAAEKVLAQTQGQYQALLEQVCTLLSTAHYYTALTASQLQQQAMSLAQTLVQLAKHAAVAKEHTFKYIR
jgi:hypothetical protein